jgi:flagellar hook-associated protein 1
MSGLLGVGLRSLMAYQSAIKIAAQNLENARTPFYSRKQIDFVESMFNSGVQVSDVRRIYDEVANKALIKCGSDMHSASKFLENIADLEKILDNDTTGLHTQLNDSLQALQELTKDVSSPQLRSAYLAKLSSMAARLKQVGSDVAKRRDDINQSMTKITSTSNDLIKQIADLNTRIQSVNSNDRSPLLDQRNALVHQLAQYMNFETTTDSSDSLKLTLANGLELVSGSQYNQLSLQADPVDSSQQKMMLLVGSSQSDITSMIGGGELYGLMRVKTEALDAIEMGLGRLSYALSTTFNRQNKSGVDQNGNLGGNIFKDINDAAYRAGRVITSGNNLGSGTIDVNITDANQLKLSQYQLVFSDATNYTVKRLSDNTVVSSGTIAGYPTSIAIDGATIDISAGTFQAGDTFTIKPMQNALLNISLEINDPSRLALGFPVSASGLAGNIGQGQITVDAITDTSNAAFSTPKQLNPPIKIVFLSDTSYQLVNANTNAVLEGPLSYDPNGNNNVFPSTGGYDPGYRISLKGVIKAGDVFNINYNTNISGDNRNAIIFSKLYTDKVLGNGTLTFNEAYHFTASDISSKTNIAKTELESTMVMFTQAETRYNQISGVSNIEEMSNLSEYQESYQACAQVIQVAKTVFDTIIGLAR